MRLLAATAPEAEENNQSDEKLETAQDGERDVDWLNQVSSVDR